MEGGILAPGAVTWPIRPQATAAAFEESKAADVPRRYLRGRELHASNGEVRGTEEENVLWSPRRTSNDGQWPGHHSLHTLRPPCPPRPSGVPEPRRTTGAGAGLGTCRDGHSRAGKPETEAGQDPRWAVLGCAGTPAAMPRSGPAPCFPLGWVGAADRDCHSSCTSPPQFPTADGSGRQDRNCWPGLLQPAASYLEEGRGSWTRGGTQPGPPAPLGAAVSGCRLLRSVGVSHTLT